MRRRTGAIVVGVLILASLLIFFAPVIYSPAVSPSDCNPFCASGGHGQYYMSVSFNVFGVGGYYLPEAAGTYYVAWPF